MKQTEKKKAKPYNSKTRLKEIIKVLLKHRLTKGITPEKVRLIIEDLGPTFVKLGQVMSMRYDMLPHEYCEELKLLRTAVAPMPYQEIRELVERELDQPLEQLFLAFEETPLGSASIAQVHKAVLLNGSVVVVKVQRKNIRRIMSRDMVLLRKAAGILNFTGAMGGVIDFRMVFDEMWSVAQQEMNFLVEAQNMADFAALNKDIAFVCCPTVEGKYTTSKVLVMEYIDGIRIDHTDELEKQGYDLVEIAAKLTDHYVKQIIDDAFFQADPHPGNIWVRDGKLVWIDLGMMGRLSKGDRILFKNAVRAIAENNIQDLEDIMLAIGVHTGRINRARLYADLDDLFTRYGKMSIAQMDFSIIMEELFRVAKENNISMPKGISMLSRGMVTLQGVVAELDPDANILGIMTNRTFGEATRQINLQKELLELGIALYRSGKKAVDVPGQFSDTLRMVNRGQMKVNLELLGSEEPLSAIDKMVNKLVACIITAGLLVGSCLICTTDMNPKILGIPALGMLGFLTALFLSIRLVVGIIRKKR